MLLFRTESRVAPERLEILASLILSISRNSTRGGVFMKKIYKDPTKTTNSIIYDFNPWISVTDRLPDMVSNV